MDSFFGGSKSSLHETIRSQQERLAKYEKKLGDLIKAYKILQEEKSALEDTVNVFSSQSEQHVECGTVNNRSSNEGESSDPLKIKVAALTKTLASLNETKSTLEMRFQHDKKELLEQIENFKFSVASEQAALQRERSEHEGQLKDLKSKLRNEQHEREQEQTHHVAMLRELQHMLATERNSNQRLELELDDLRSSQNFEKQRNLFGEKIQLLQEEKSYLSSELSKLIMKSKEPPANFVELQQEVEELRQCKCELALLKEERENTAYQHLHLQNSADQNRIRDLENRLTDLSELIAAYDSQQKRDQAEIARLQSRVSCLEAEGNKRGRVSVSVNTNIILAEEPTTPTSPDTAVSGKVTPFTPGVTKVTGGVTPFTPGVTKVTGGVTPFTPGVTKVTGGVTPFTPGVTKNREVVMERLREDLKVCKMEIQRLHNEKKHQQRQLLHLTEEHKQQLKDIAIQHSLEMSELDKGNGLRLRGHP